MRKPLHYLFYPLFFFFYSVSQLFSQTNTVYGVVQDSITKESIPGAIVYLEGTNVSTITDYEGNFSFKIYPGKHKLVCSYITYKTFTKEISVKKDSIRVDVFMVQDNQSTLNEVNIVTEKLLNTNASLALLQKENISMSDGVSAEIIKKTADRTTSDVLKRVSGVSVMNNKFVVVRGLNERYNINFLNNAPLPSTESDKRAFAYDIIPSQIIDNILINKTATPDMPADFAGGNIQITTKSIPDKTFFQVSASTGYNSLATNQEFVNYSTSKYHWLAIYDKSQDLPKAIPENPKDWITNAQQVEMAKNFSNDFKTQTFKALPNMSMNFTGGWVHSFKNNHKIGIVFSQNYNNSFNRFATKRTNYTNNANNDGEAMLDDYYNITTSQNIVMNTSLLNLGYKFNPQHQIEFKNLLVLNSNKSYIEQNGTIAPLDSNRTVDRNTAMFYTHSKLVSSQIAFKNEFEKIRLKSHLTFGYGHINILTPNVRYMSYSKFVRIQNPPDPSEPPPPYVRDTMYAANVALASTGPDYAGYRFYSKTNEDIRSVKWDISKKVDIHQVKLDFQTGFYFQQRQRNFDIRQLGYAKYTQMGKFFNDTLLYLPPDLIFEPENIGVLPNNTTGFKLIETTKPSDKYFAKANNYATYLMTTFEWRAIKIITGVRYEYYHQIVNYRKSSQDTINIDDTYKNILPSVNLIYNINSIHAVRLSYAQTINRPEFRELAAVSWYNPINRLVYYGNDSLLPASIHNVDVRYEVYPGKGQLFTITPFYKYFIQPIEQVMSSGYNNEITWVNAKFANVYGIETEFRIQLSSIFKPKNDSAKDNNIWERISIFNNFALIKSEVTLPDYIHSARDKRPLQGQSPFLINTGINYYDKKIKWGFSIAYNRVGRRIVFAGNQLDPDRYETGRDIIDVQIEKHFFKDKLEMKFNIRDVLAQSQYIYQNSDNNNKYNKSADYTLFQTTYPRIYQFSISYKF